MILTRKTRVTGGYRDKKTLSCSLQREMKDSAGNSRFVMNASSGTLRRVDLDPMPLVTRDSWKDSMVERSENLTKGLGQGANAS